METQPENQSRPTQFRSPKIVALPNGAVLAASCHHTHSAAFHFSAGQSVFPDGKVLFKLQGDTLVPKLLLRGGGDRGYNGMIWHDNHLWLVYNSPSRKAGKSCIYFAQIKLTTR